MHFFGILTKDVLANVFQVLANKLANTTVYQEQGAEPLQKVPYLATTWLTSSLRVCKTLTDTGSSIKRLATCCYPSIASKCMILCSLVVRSLHPCLLKSLALQTVQQHCKVRRARTRLRKLRHTQSHMVQYKCNGVYCVCAVLETQASTESNCHSTNILVVKGTVHTRLKGICAKATVIALANFDIGCLRKIS